MEKFLWGYKERTIVSRKKGRYSEIFIYYTNKMSETRDFALVNFTPIKIFNE